MLLDDFFIHEPVDTERIDECKEWMEQNPKIVVFSFEDVIDAKNITSIKYPGFELRPSVGAYKLNMQAALWNTNTLKKKN